MNSKLLLIIPFLILSMSGYCQVNVKINYPDNVNAPLTKKEKLLIKEVYQSKAKDLVFNNEEYLRDIKHLLRNRILIYEDSNVATQKKGKLLSQIPLFNTYNDKLKREDAFKPEHFNPLKYQLDFFARGTYVYHIDNTNYFIQVTSQYRKNNR